MKSMNKQHIWDKEREKKIQRWKFNKSEVIYVQSMFIVLFFKKKIRWNFNTRWFWFELYLRFHSFFVVVVAYAVVVFFVFKLFVVDFYVYIICKWFYFAHFFLSTTKTKPKTKRIQNILYLFYFSVNYDSALIWIKGTWYNNIK